MDAGVAGTGLGKGDDLCVLRERILSPVLEVHTALLRQK